MGTLVSSGPLSAHETGYVRWLAERGYRPGAVAERVRQFRALSRWLRGRGLAVAELNAERVHEFLDDRRTAGFRTYVAASSVRLPLDYLRTIGIVPAPEMQRASSVDRLLEEYRCYLSLERRLAETTIAGYERVARVFLEHRVGRCGGLELERLSAADVTAFVAAECRRLTDGAARGRVAKLRPFLVYLHVTGRIGAPLRWAVPKVADMRGRAMPRALDSEAVAALLASCDRRRVVGCRDYAIVVLLVRLGMRAGEVAAVQLEDIAWRGGELVVRGKGDRRDRLPLPVDVGQALAAYLQHRPSGQSRAVFVGTRAPNAPLTREAVGSVVRAACSRAGIPTRCRPVAQPAASAADCLRRRGGVWRGPILRCESKRPRTRTGSLAWRVKPAADCRNFVKAGVHDIARPMALCGAGRRVRERG